MSDAETLPGEEGNAPSTWFGRNVASPTDRIPALVEAMAESGKAWSDSLGAMSSLPCDITFVGFEANKVEALPGRHPGSIFAVLQTPTWTTAVGLQFDRTFLTTMVEALFGGEGDDDDLDANQAPSPMELRIADVIAGQIAEALTTGFAAHGGARFVHDRLLSKPDLSFLGKPAANVVIGTFAISTLGRTVNCDLLIASTSLTIVAEQIAAARNAKQSADPRWSRQLETELSHTAVPLRAVLDGPQMSLGAVAALTVGQVLALPTGAGQRVTLSCADATLFRCELGQSDGFYTLRIQDMLGATDASADGTAPSAPDLAVPDPIEVFPTEESDIAFAMPDDTDAFPTFADNEEAAFP